MDIAYGDLSVCFITMLYHLLRLCSYVNVELVNMEAAMINYAGRNTSESIKRKGDSFL
jgi:hypothetical protein